MKIDQYMTEMMRQFIILFSKSLINFFRMEAESLQNRSVRPKFVQKIAVKSRQFNFSQDNPSTETLEPQKECDNQLVIYNPHKKIKTDVTAISDLHSLKNGIVAQFVSQLNDITRNIKLATSSKVNEKPQRSETIKNTKLSSKIQRKESQMIRRLCCDEYISPIPPQLDFEFQIESLKKMNELSDGGVINLSKNLSRLSTPNLTLDLNKKWHTDQSNLSDSAVENLSKGLYHMPELTDLQLGLYGWGYWNENITDIALNHITTAITSLKQLNALKLDLNMWAYSNDRITDQGTETLLGGISTMKGLGKLEINMKGWGDSNENITDESVNHLSKCLSKLGNLSEVKLILWDKISKQAISRLNRSLAELENLTKIDLKFETSSSVPAEPIENPKLNLLQHNAQRKRKLMFQSHAMHEVLGGMIRHDLIEDIAGKLL